jgi:integrative and conjugative element protein (TIGR02256 family)
MLSGLIAGAFPEASSNPAASLRIWSKTPDGGVACVRVPTECVRTIIGDWALTVPTSLLRELVLKRNDALPSETGGPLVGVADYEAHHIGVVHALPHPADSVGTPMGFERGTRGMQRSIDEAKARSGGQVRYLGEWHSHPQGHSATPSNIDMQQLDQLSLALSIDGLPALSLIVGEGELGMMLREAVR